MKYLLDTNICVFFFRGLSENVARQMKRKYMANCFISDVTVAELRYGVECSSRRQENAIILNQFIKDIGGIIPFDIAIDTFATEKARLRKMGQRIDDFDLIIGCTAVATGMTMVTDNLKHFQRIEGIELENWVER